MSRSVDLFIDHSDDDAHQLLVMLGTSIHGAPVDCGAGRWELCLSPQLVATVYRHPYVDDGDLKLSRYPWVVSIRVGHEGSLLDHPATIALRMLAEDLRAHHRRILLVLDLQNRIDIGPDTDSDTTAAGPGDPVAGPGLSGEPVAATAPASVDAPAGAAGPGATGPAAQASGDARGAR